MNRRISIIALGSVTLALALPLEALAKERCSDGARRYSARRLGVEKRQVITRITPSDAFQTVSTPVTYIAVPSNGWPSDTVSGADARGVAVSTGAGIGESSSRSDVGTGVGGAGIVSGGTLAASAVLPAPGTAVATTIPMRPVTIAAGGTYIAPVATRRTRVVTTRSGRRVTIAAGGTRLPAAPTTVVTSGTYFVPVIPRDTTYVGTLGAGTSTPVGVAPGR